MKYDWDRDWYEGDLGKEKRNLFNDNPLDALLALLLGAAILVLWGIA